MDDLYNSRLDGSAGELDLLGSSPILPLASLNLAGIDGVKPPDALAHPALDMQVRQPDYLSPDSCEPSLKFGNLALAEIDYIPELTPDPLLLDMKDVPKPEAMDIYNDPFMSCFPNIAQDIPSDAEIAASIYPGLGFTGMEVLRDPNAIDDPLPDLQDPELKQQTVMRDRPGELDDSAMDVAETTPQNGDGDDDGDDYLPPYKQSFMTMDSDNSHRGRKMDLLLSGLEEPGQALW